MKGRKNERGPSTTLLETSNNTGGWRNHYVNGLPFTIGIATLGLILVAAVLFSATMLVSESALEANELGPVPDEAKSKVYGATHSGVGFANYVVGNEVKHFWNSELGHSAPSDPFAAA
eukprot:CAMPEP_0172190044 /NCGR_PEP_ID=MMETSP1050-20130122/22882_1 /TAXON_ID=233186 /ORGANISM="Cryptomonas curvata, Strain CCAP979/52" /LENGTH=117 /DNA_ID=CAMNT_0012864849 /DNA_START=1 /DNA_END=351 /DNA_ORIENTATION=+